MPSFVVIDVWYRLRELEKRAWKQARCVPARKYVEISELSQEEDARLDQLWDAREEHLTEVEQKELYALLRKCRIGCSDESEREYEEDDENGANEKHDIDLDESGREKSAGLEDEIQPDAEDDASDDYQERDQADDIITEWDPVALAFVIAFHRYASQHNGIIFPDWGNLLHQFLILTGSRLFEKYGWIAGQDNCLTIAPLEQWSYDDRSTLTTLYERSDPYSF